MGQRTSTRFRRERAAVPSARAFVAHALRSAGATTEAVERLVLAVAEACNNVIFHADGPAFTVSVLVDGGHATVTVADTGSGFDPPDHPTMPAPDAAGKRGLPLMQALVDHVAVKSDDGGTTVALVHRLAPTGRWAPVGADR
ncbi:MAG TPA: ATP-binding protein [Acidimicrobiales bacterium]